MLSNDACASVSLSFWPKVRGALPPYGTGGYAGSMGDGTGLTYTPFGFLLNR